MAEIPYESMNIQWFPGHMTKAKREMQDSLQLVDVVCEILDARIPYSSRNPEIDDLRGDKPKLVLLNRTDLADPKVTEEWIRYWEEKETPILPICGKSGKNINRIVPEVKKLISEKLEAYKAKGQAGRTIRIMILGIPNVGKSTVINQLAHRKVSAVGNRPGVTRGRQWIKIDNSTELLDTPGILWPKFESQEVAEMLAVTSAIKTEVLDVETLAANFILRLREYYPDAIRNRYKFDPPADANGFELLELAARKRGFLVSGGDPDYERMAHTLLSEYHDGKLGNMTLEKPHD